jgi:small GTP-binding protein
MKSIVRWNVCMVGATGVGKTSLVRRFVENVFEPNFMPTFGLQITKRIVETEEAHVSLNLWDVAGDDEFLFKKDLVKAVRQQNRKTEKANFYILVADVSRRATLDEAISRQERIALDKISKDLPDAPFVLALNKSDLSEREFDEKEAQLLVPGWQIISTSAKSGDNVAHMFEAIAARASSILTRRRQ